MLTPRVPGPRRDAAGRRRGAGGGHVARGGASLPRMETHRRPTAIVVGAIGAVAAAVVIAVAFVTGTADDLPWGAIIGLGVILAALVGGARRRERRMREAFPDDEE